MSAGAARGSRLTGPMQEVIRVELDAGVPVASVARFCGVDRDAVRVVRDGCRLRARHGE